MAISAFVRIRLKTPSKATAVAKKIAKVEDVEFAKAVIGECHILTLVKTRNIESLGTTIINIRSTSPLIMSTNTSIAVFEQHRKKA